MADDGCALVIVDGRRANWDMLQTPFWPLVMEVAYVNVNAATALHYTARRIFFFRRSLPLKVLLFLGVFA